MSKDSLLLGLKNDYKEQCRRIDVREHKLSQALASNKQKYFDTFTRIKARAAPPDPFRHIVDSELSKRTTKQAPLPLKPDSPSDEIQLIDENDDSEPPEAPFVHSRRPKVGSATDNLIDEPIKRVDASKMQSLNRSKSLSLMSTASQRRSLMLASGFESSEPNPSNASNKRSGDSKFDLTDIHLHDLRMYLDAKDDEFEAARRPVVPKPSSGLLTSGLSSAARSGLTSNKSLSTIHSVGSSRPLSASRHSQSELSVAEPHNESNLTAVAAALSAELPSGASEGDFNPNFVRIMRDLKRSERKAAEEAEKARIEELKQEAEARAAAAKAVAERARQREENDDGESDSTVPLSTDVVPISTPVMSPKTAPALPKSPNFALLFRPSTSSSSGRPQSSKQQLAVSSSVGNLHSQTWSKERMFPLGQSLSSLKQQHVKVAQPTLSQNPSYLSQQYASIVNSTPSETLKVAKSKSFRNLADFQLIDSLFHSNSTSSLPQSDAAEPNAALVIPKSDPREVYRTIQSKILTPPTLPSPPPNPFTVKPPIELTPLVLATSASVPAFETKSNHSRPVSAAVSRFSQETPRFGRFGIFTAAPGASAPVPHNEQHVRIGSLLLRLKQPTASTSTAIDQQSRTKLANTIGKSQTISKPEPVQSIISMVSDRLFVCRDVEQEFGWASVGSFQVLEPLPCIPNSETTLKHDNPPVHDTIVAQTNTNSHDQSQKSSPRKATMSVHSGSRVAFNAQSLPDMLPKPRPSTADQLADKARVEELRRQNELRMRKLAERSMSDAQRKEIAREEKLAAQKAEARKKQLQAMEFPLPVKTKPIDNSDAKPSDSVYETSSGSAPNNAPLQSSITIRKAGGYQQEVLEAEWQLCSADIKHVLTEMRAEEIGAYLFSRVNHLSDCFEVPGLKIEPNHEHRGRATSSASKAARAAELERCSRLDAQFNRLAALGLSMQLQKLVARLTGALVRDVLEHRKKAVHSQSKA